MVKILAYSQVISKKMSVRRGPGSGKTIRYSITHAIRTPTILNHLYVVTDISTDKL